MGEVMIEKYCVIDIHRKSIIRCIIDVQIYTNKPRKSLK